MIFGLALSLGCASASAAERDWKNSGTDFNTNADWQTSGGAATTFPAAGDVGYFKTAASVQPNLSASDSIAGLYFNGTGSSGYTLTQTNSAVLTLTGYSTTGSSGTSNSGAAALRSDITSLTNTISVPLVLAPASANISAFYQAGGGTLVVNGAVSGSGVNLSLRGGGTIQLNGGNSFGSASIDTAGETVVLGNNGALGSGALTVSNTATLQAGTAARSIGNSVVLAADTTLSGGNDLGFTGSVTSSGSASRMLTVSSGASTTLSGSVYLAPDDTTARGLTINGTSAVMISGVVANNSGGNTVASPLTYSGSSTLTLTGSNTYTGNTTVSNGTLKAASAAGRALGGTSLVKVNGGGVVLMGANNQFNATAPAPLTLTGTSTNAATFRVGGFNQGSTTTTGIGALTLSTSAVNNVLDFGNTAGLVSFSSFTSNNATLTISNYVDNGGASGGADQLIFNQDEMTSLGSFTFTGYGAATEANLGGGFFEVYPMPVPEPATLFGGLLLVAAAAWSQRRRLFQAMITVA